MGGLTLDPTCLEITYGLERIAMALQNVRSVFDLKWDNVRTYGDVKLQEEKERSEYAFNQADVEELHELFEKYERECRRTLDKGLVLPSHDYVLQCSNVFNMLDTRGAIGVTERARFLGRMRDLARETATKYVEQRVALGHPWLVAPVDAPALSTPVAAPVLTTTPAPLLIEIGVEELPADVVVPTSEQLGKLLTDALDAARIAHGAVSLFATPRRIAAVVADVAPAQRALDEWVKGPGAKAAFDAAGNPTQAAIGFAKRFGMDAKDLVVKSEGNASYVYGRKQEAGRPSGAVLTELLPGLLAKITFEKTMRWNASNVSFSRPVNWLVALLDNAVIPFEFAGVRSSNTSLGPRGEGSQPFAIAHAADYSALLAQHNVLGDVTARKAEVKRQIDAVAASIGARVADDDDLLEEVANLVEQPTALLCDFEAEFLKIPAQVLTSVMSKKQRYFTVLDTDGALINKFITVRNGNAQHLDLVRHGNEDVVRARFADANYFFKADVQRPLETYLTRLDTIIFQGKLGSMLDKSKRIESLIEPIAAALQADAATAGVAQKAAHLCKADLATNMVVEITALQGSMGRDYHLLTSTDADKAPVAQAIFEHYLPRYSGDKSPVSTAGLIVGLADKLDSIAGLFAVGLGPKGSADPFALRRAAIGIVTNLISAKRSFSVAEGIKSAAARLPVKMDDVARAAATDFIVDRARVIFGDAGHKYDVIDAVLAVQGENPFRANALIEQLGAAVRSERWPKLLAAFSRCARITAKADISAPKAVVVDPSAEAQALAAVWAGVEKPADVTGLIGALDMLEAPITAFSTKPWSWQKTPISNRHDWLCLAVSLGWLMASPISASWKGFKWTGRKKIGLIAGWRKNWKSSFATSSCGARACSTAANLPRHCLCWSVRYKLKPDNYDAALNFGGAYIMAGRFKYAVPILEAATEKHGDQPQLWVNLGAAYLGNPILADDEKQRKALDAFNRAVALDPYTPNVEYNIGLIHRDRGELQLAINAFERALKVNPNDADAKSLIARLQSKLDEDSNKV